jgi:hypothetical protein
MTTPTLPTLADAEPPAPLRRLDAHLAQTKDDANGVALTYAISCVACPSQEFEVDELTVGEDVRGVQGRCSRCGSLVELFDAVVDGYNGVYGLNAELRQDMVSKPLLDADRQPILGVQLLIRYNYSIDVEELLVCAEETGAQPQDLFDWFTLLAKAPDAGDWREIWEFECA